MLELERLGVRVVSGRLGRKAGEEDDEVPEKKPSGKFLSFLACGVGTTLNCVSYVVIIQIL